MEQLEKWTQTRTQNLQQTWTVGLRLIMGLTKCTALWGGSYPQTRKTACGPIV